MDDKILRKLLLSTIVISLLGSLIIGLGLGFWLGKGGQWSLTPANKLNSGSNISNYQGLGDYESRIITAVKETDASVVSIIASKDLPVIEQYYVNPFGDNSDLFGNLFPNFMIPQYRQNGTKNQEVSAGSGFIVSENGYIVTNRHVVEDTAATYTVLTNDGAKYPAKVIARDPYEDFAVVKIDKTGLKPIVLGDSSNVVLGQTVIVIGNALGEFRNTVSVGVISGLSRTLSASSGNSSETLSDVIQTDAAINRGNSGGPLLNIKGEVIGINTAIASGAQNIGFAIPINKIKKSLQGAITSGKITVPYLGVRYIAVNVGIQAEKKLPVDYGALVAKSGADPAIIKNSPADKAGIKEGDIILEINGKKIGQSNPLSSAIRNYSVGETINLKILRDNKESVITAVLAERKD